MAKYRKKPVVIEAFEWNPSDHIDNAPEWFYHAVRQGEAEIGGSGNVMYITTLEGVMQAHPGDYIIQGLRGELYPCKPDIFEASYEEVENDQDS